MALNRYRGNGKQIMNRPEGIAHGSISEQFAAFRSLPRGLVSAAKRFSAFSGGLSRFCRALSRDLLLVFQCGSPTCFSCGGVARLVRETRSKTRFLRHASACYRPPALRPHRLNDPCAFGHRIPASFRALVSQAQGRNKPVEAPLVVSGLL